jgi:N-acyl homoserine lactone hydrolase
MASVDILMQGFPGWSPTHGRLAWPSLCLIRSEGKNVLFDTGHLGAHPILLERLAERGVGRAAVDMLLISHSHWDHSVGYPLFPNAEVVIGRRELEWALSVAPGENLSIPPFLMQHLAEDPRLRTVEDNTEVLSGVTMIDTPGHTPGHMSVVVSTAEGTMVLAQDAVKNRAEFLSRAVDQSMDSAASVASIERIAGIADVVVPGHDRAFRVRDGGVEYISELRAEILAKTSPDLGETTVFSIILR